MKHRLGIAVVSLIVCLLAWLPSQASAAKTGVIASADGTNGYEIHLDGRGDKVTLYAISRKNSGGYTTKGIVKKRRIRADFGEFGSVDLRFFGDGRGPENSFHNCRVRNGVWKGALSFRATNGFTETYATQLPGTRTVGSWSCHFFEGSSVKQDQPHDRPEEDLIWISNEDSRPAQEISVLGIGGGKRGLAVAMLSERVSSVGVTLSSSVHLKRRHLRFNSERRRAKLNPPAPFSGIGKFRGNRRPDSRWRGDLAVTLPGIGETPLTGPSFTVYFGLLRTSLDKFFPRVRPLRLTPRAEFR